MAIKKNNAIVRNHFRKSTWQTRVRVHLDQAGKKASRRVHRAQKAATIAPKPLDQLRPLVRACTIKYNRKIRLGRGFSLEELKAAGIPKQYAKTIGIAVDHRRQNRNVEAFDANVQRLKEYQAKLIVFPRKNGQPKKGDSTESPASVEQVKDVNAKLFPVVQDNVLAGSRAITADEKNVEAYKLLRKARSDKKQQGKREKRAREKAEAEADKKK